MKTANNKILITGECVQRGKDKGLSGRFAKGFCKNE
jgi:hypothetical protein